MLIWLWEEFGNVNCGFLNFGNFEKSLYLSLFHSLFLGTLVGLSSMVSLNLHQSLNLGDDNK